MTKQIPDFMGWLGGADAEILDKVPQERARFVQMAGVLLTTASIAILSMIFALHDGVRIPLVPALLLGLFWGLIILNLDRFLVLSIGSTRKIWHLALLALPRLALAAVLALVISTPLVLRIFASDINKQLYTMQLQTSRQQAQMESQTKEQQQLNQADKHISNDNAILGGQVPAATSPQLQADQSQVARLQPQAASAFQTQLNAYRTWTCEVQGQSGVGCNGASGKAGNGPRAQTDQQAYERDRAIYDSLESQLKHAQVAQKEAQAGAAKNDPGILAQAQQQARNDLTYQIPLRNRLRDQISAESAAGTQVNQANTGILAQLQALSEASAKSTSLNVARLAVLALFFLIEILPVTVKILLNLAPETAYDIAARARNDQVSAQLAEQRRIDEIESQARIERAEVRSQAKVKDAQMQDSIEDNMRTLQEGLGKKANKHVVAEMMKILDTELRHWSKQVHDRISASGNGPSPGKPVNGSPPPNTSQELRFRLPDGGAL